MGRPTRPLIDRETAVEAALRIIDEEGLDAFSLPRLGRELGVQAPSLYHHFQDKDEILTEVARAITRETVIPRRPDPENWPEWFVAFSVNVRATVLSHRNAAVLLLQYLPRERLTDLYNQAAIFLEECRVPERLHVQILDGLETLTLGAAVTEATRKTASRRVVFPNVDPAREPALAAAIKANPYSPKALFQEMVRSFLRGVIELDAERHGVASAA
jgi:AcrR family transcriptional regulator